MKIDSSYKERMASWPKEIQRSIERIVEELSPLYPEKAVLRKAWAGVGIKDGENWSVTLYEGKDGVNVMIMRGKMLDDPEGLLDGSGVSTRNYRVKSLGQDLTPLKGFIEQQLALFESGVRWE